jgi:hypothetical protein
LAEEVDLELDVSLVPAGTRETSPSGA